MRRWNGWGDETVSAALPARAVEALAEWVGPGTPPRDATPALALSAVSPSRLVPGGALTLDPWERLLHARGQSLPDWIALRSRADRRRPRRRRLPRDGGRRGLAPGVGDESGTPGSFPTAEGRAWRGT